MGLRLEVRHVRVLLAVAEEGSLVRAARRLGIPQPSLSTQLRRIERAIDTELFHRSHRGVVLTDSGRDLLPHLRAIDEHMCAVENADGPAGAGPAPIRVGVECGALLDLLESTGRLSEHPLQLGVCGPPTTETALLDGSFDLVQTSGAPGRAVPHPFRTAPVLDEELGVLVPPGHPAGGRDRLLLADLADADWVCSLPGTAWHKELLRVAAAVGFHPRIRYLATAQASLDELARHTSALALGTASSVARGGLRLHCLGGGFTRRMTISWSSVTVPTPVVAEIVGRIRDWRVGSLSQGRSRS